MADSLEKLNAKILSENLHTKFKVHLQGADAVELEIIEVTEPSTVPKLELLVVNLRGHYSPRLIQQVHRLGHEMLGILDIFLTTGAEDNQRPTYEPVIKRVR